MRAYNVFVIIESMKTWCANIVPEKLPLQGYKRLATVVYY